MFSLPDGFLAQPGLRIRPVPEWDGCLVFDPLLRRLSELNLTAWLVLTLCDGRPVAAMQAAFEARLGERVSPPEAASFFRRGLFQLVGAGLVRRSMSPSPACREEQ